MTPLKPGPCEPGRKVSSSMLQFFVISRLSFREAAKVVACSKGVALKQYPPILYNLCARYYSGLAHSNRFLGGAKESSQSTTSKKIMIRLTKASFSQTQGNSLHTSLQLFSKRLGWPAAISPQRFTFYTTQKVAQVRTMNNRAPLTRLAPLRDP